MSMRRRAFGLSGVTALVTAALAGCTLLIPFDDVPGGADASHDADLPVRGDGSVADVSVGPIDAGIADAPRDIGLEELSACVGMTNGLYCGNNQIKDYPGSSDDLVACDGGKVVYVKPCSTGGGCLHMVNPHPDACDECARKASGGYYCGRDMYQWVSGNANVRVQCMAGAVVGTTLCTTCTSNGNASTCP
jgi:hypothetical protein